MKIGIIGHGFVGQAVEYGFRTPGVECFLVDPRHKTTIENMNEFRPTVVFICVPTPMSDDGSVDDSHILDALDRIEDNPLIIIKSTIPPNLAEKLCYDRVVYNPEFLVESSAKADFVDPIMHVFGGSDYGCAEAEMIYRTYSHCSPAPVFRLTAFEASFVKYTVNSFLSLKITFFNQLYDAIGTKGNFNAIVSAACTDPRIGQSHTKVPGFDGKRGFGGACFPKDSKAFTKFTDKMTLLEKAIEINNLYRGLYTLSNREKDQNVNFK